MDTESYSPAVRFHISNLSTCFLWVPYGDVWEVRCLDVNLTGRPLDFVLSGSILIDEVGELLHVYTGSTLHLSRGLELLCSLRFVVVRNSLQRCYQDLATGCVDVVVEKCLELEGSSGRQCCVLHVKIRADLVLGECDDICELEWLVVFSLDTGGRLECCDWGSVAIGGWGIVIAHSA